MYFEKGEKEPVVAPLVITLKGSRRKNHLQGDIGIGVVGQGDQMTIKKDDVRKSRMRACRNKDCFPVKSCGGNQIRQRLKNVPWI